MKSSQVTIKDIALQLNISPSTVSRALKDHPDISSDTKKAVNELAKKLHYQPNSIALSLRKQRSFTIGVIIPEIVHYFFSNVISGIEDVADKEGYHVIICQSNESYEREVRSTHALLSSRVDGFLVALSRETENYEHFEEIYDKGIPIVFFDRICEKLDTSRVIVDDFDGAFKAVEHLISIGCKRIAHLAGPEKLLISKYRLNGYLEALKKHQIAIDEQLIIHYKEGTREEGQNYTQRLIHLSHPPDGIFAHNDVVAIGSIQALKSHGLNVPEDIAVVGFSNWEFSSYTDPTVSSVSQPGYEMGMEAARLFINQMKEKEDYKSETKVLKTELIIRASSMR